MKKKRKKNGVAAMALAGVLMAAVWCTGCSDSRDTAKDGAAASDTEAAAEQMTGTEAEGDAVPETGSVREGDAETGTDESAQADDAETGTDESAQAELAPDFETVLSTGETVKLSDYRGKKVLLNFWATWCGYCIMEFPALDRLSQDYPDELVVLAVDCGEEEAVVQDYLEKNDYAFLVGLDEAGTIQRLYPTNGIPYTVLIDENGTVLQRTTGIPAREEAEIYAYYREKLGLA